MSNIRQTKSATVFDLERERSIDTNQVADLLGLSAVTLHQWRLHGKGPAFHRFGRQIRYKLGDVLDWRDARAVGS